MIRFRIKYWKKLVSTVWDIEPNQGSGPYFHEADTGNSDREPVLIMKLSMCT